MFVNFNSRHFVTLEPLSALNIFENVEEPSGTREGPERPSGLVNVNVHFMLRNDRAEKLGLEQTVEDLAMHKTHRKLLRQVSSITIINVLTVITTYI